MRARTERHRPTPVAQSKPAPGHDMHEKDLPPKPAELTWRDYLIMLLHIAAELEQSLMVQYLYAAYSLGGEQAREHETKVQEWRNAIIGVAKEEMGHLLTVQNVICLLGGPISFERDDYPWDTPYYPFTFCLEPLTLQSLAKYVFAEMPERFADDDKDFDIAKAARDMLGLAGGHPVGEIYDHIIDIVGNEELIPDSDFNADSYGIQASFDDWGRGYQPSPLPPHAKSTDTPRNERSTRLIIARAATRTEAVAALKDVAEQGESGQRSKSAELSHFERFARVFRELKELQDREPSWSPSRDVPVNPVIADPTRDVDKKDPGRRVQRDRRKSNEHPTHITAEPSRTWASLFNVRYRMLLTYLSHTYRISRPLTSDDDAVFPAVMAKIFGEMYNLKTLSGILVRLPLVHADDARRAGPTFQMPYTLTLPAAEADVWRQHRDLVRSSQELVGELLHPDKNNLADAPLDGRKYLLTLRDLDLQSIAFIEQVLIGLRPARRGRK
ncbi:MAG: ferritin-like domain-containing protein [bacterium]